MTKSKRDKLRIKILDSLKGKAELSTNRGKFIQSQFTKPNKKTKRHSGRYTPQIQQKGKFSEMIANAEEPGEEYDDWENYRDGFRRVNFNKSRFLIPYYKFGILTKERIKKINKKLKRQVARRKAKLHGGFPHDFAIHSKKEK